MDHPIICFGQQPCGFFPKRFLFAKIVTARRLQKEIGGEIVFFCHDSDHDPRETSTILRDHHSNRDVALNFQFENRIQKQFSPLYAKRVLPEWREKTARQLPSYVPETLVEHFKETGSSNVADFCLEMYTRMGLLDGVRVERSSAPEFRARAARSQTISSISRMKEKSFVHVIATENCCCTKAAIDFWKFPEANSVRNKSARLETRVLFGCNQ